jgi:hypothetical protein
MYATPLDERSVVVRAAPETPLRVFVHDGSTAELSVVLRDSDPALTPGELADSLRYFEVSRSAVRAYWWATRIPARFRLRQVRGRVEADGAPADDAVLVGELVEHGRVAQLPEPVEARPRPPGDPPLFRACEPPDAGVAERHIPRDPRVLPLVPVFAAPAVQGWLAEVPEYGPGRVWLRTAPHRASRPLPPEAFAAEAELLRWLAEARPESAVRALHRGTVDLAGRGDRVPYLATSAPVGFEVDDLFRAAPAAYVEGWATELAAELLRTLGAAHAGGWCVGGLSPPLLRVRPAFHHSPPGLRAVLAAAPLAGRAGSPLTSDELERLPGWSGRARAPTRRTPRDDLGSLGMLLAKLLDPWLSAGHPLRPLAAELQAGAFASADEALRAAPRAETEHARPDADHRPAAPSADTA